MRGLVGLLLVGAAWAQDVPPPPASLPPVAHPRLQAVARWAYWIQDPDLDVLATQGPELVVIDVAQDGSGDTTFGRERIARLQQGGRRVIAYLSLGEAEDYRAYWGLDRGTPGADWAARPPAWLGPENPDWPGNFKVRYWDPSWQALVIANPGKHPVLGDAPSCLDRILAAGFDGVFLDVVDAFEHWGPKGDGGNGERPSAARDMAAFVVALAAHARRARPEFVVCQQNGEALLSPDLERPLSAKEREALLAAVDWLSVEDVFYRGDAEANNHLDPEVERVPAIDAYRRAGKLVTAIDYFDPDAPGFAADAFADFCRRARARGWLPSTGPRALNRLSPLQPK
ncbi:MAG: endo alpha-1,4 polygalactosaminidase [Planctomycetota bacterium]